MISTRSKKYNIKEKEEEKADEAAMTDASNSDTQVRLPMPPTTMDITALLRQMGERRTEDEERRRRDKEHRSKEDEKRRRLECRHQEEEEH